MARIKHSEGESSQKVQSYLKESFHYNRRSYDAFLFKAVLEFGQRDISQAHRTINEAKKIAGKNGTWRYSQAFLFMYEEKFQDAVRVYKRISQVSFPGEDNIVNQVIEFNERLLEQEPGKLQCLYIMGYLMYKKAKNYPRALGYLEQFLDSATVESKYKYLTTRSSSYLTELRNSMDLK